MTGRIPAKAAKLAAAILAATAISALAAGAASATEVVYNNIPAPMPGNLQSLSFEATQTSQFGGQVELAGTARKATSVAIGMSAWACTSGSWTGSPECKTTMGAKFEWPITLSVYGVGPANSVGPLILRLTKSFNMPYRPSQNNRKCTGTAKGAWYQATTATCFHGKLFKIVFPLGGATLPSQAIISVAYNTSDYGAEPQRPNAPACESGSGGCYFDSLNVAIREKGEPEQPSVGATPDGSEVYLDSANPELFCPPGSPSPGSLVQSGPCWSEEQPAIKITAH
jgi:hypothetical protein